jgi:hypothetical protein
VKIEKMKCGISIHLTLALCFADNLRNQVIRRSTACPDGYVGFDCKGGVDECISSPYPCTGGKKEGSFCVDYDPPKKYKCGCLPGYDAVLPDSSDVIDNVTVDWRPLRCVPRDVCVGFVCHEDAVCTVSSNNTAVCICNDQFTGDGILNCAPSIAEIIVANPTTIPSTACKANSDCNKIQNSDCVKGSCLCKSGFYRSDKVNQCGVCINDQKGNNVDTGCSAGRPYCDADQGKVGSSCYVCNVDETACGECINDQMNKSRDRGCIDYDEPYCAADQGMVGQCGVCINDQKGNNVDTGCSAGRPYCDADQGKVGSNCYVCNVDETACGECINDQMNKSRDRGCIDYDEPYCAADQGMVGSHCHA